jgi:hypothetical protein
MSDINWAGLGNQRNVFAEMADGLQRGTDIRRQNERDNLFAQRQEFEIGQAKRQAEIEDEQRRRKTNVGAAVTKGDYQGARQAAEGDFDLLTSIGKLDAEQRQAARERAEDLGGFAAALMQQPYEQRKAILAQAQETLIGYGFTPEQLAAFDPSDQALQAQVASSMDLKTALEEANRQRDDRRANEAFEETKRARSVAEKQRERQLGISAGSLGVSRARLGLSREAHNARLKGVGGYGTPGVGGGVVADDDVEIDP